MRIENEVWLPVKNHSQYEISNHGRLRSAADHHIITTKPHCGGNAGNRYHAWRIGNQTQYIHKMVAEAFIGERPAGDYHVCHNDNDRTNNHVDNLRYDTRAGNYRDKIAAGTNIGGTYKLTYPVVKAIKWLLEAGWKGTKIAFMFDISPAAVSQIKNGKHWRHI